VIDNLIGGKLEPPMEGSYFAGVNPATGIDFSAIADSGSADVQLAVDAATKAFPEWAGMPPKERSRLLLRLAEAIEENADELAAAESTDTGKPIGVSSTVDIPRAQANFEFFATAILHEEQRAWSTGTTAMNIELRQPLGVVACISPWNLPLYLLTWKLAPALAAGNCVIAKPSEVTPYTAHLLGQLAVKVGVPDGVLNIIHGYGAVAGAAIVKHPDIKAISFTGGTETGAAIARTAAPMFKKLTLELGGKNPNVVFADCDYDKMLDTTVRSSFSNQGQICLCGSRILVEDSIYDRFVADFTERTAALTVGDPEDDSTDIGAVVSEQHFDKIMEHIGQAKTDGGTIATGGRRAKVDGRCANGWFIEPTVVLNLDPSCSANQEEIFGPVVTIGSFSSEAEAVSVANGTRYGLATSIWTSDIGKAQRMAANIDAGVIWINTWMLRDLRTPFGGVKDSGTGREGGFDALHFFSSQKSVTIEL
jgi:aminomuconate-semialdehyde/2-hydroxymuconate-6-semialdehyde dehydrogenase